MKLKKTFIIIRQGKKHTKMSFDSIWTVSELYNYISDRLDEENFGNN